MFLDGVTQPIQWKTVKEIVTFSVAANLVGLKIMQTVNKAVSLTAAELGDAYIGYKTHLEEDYKGHHHLAVRCPTGAATCASLGVL